MRLQQPRSSSCGQCDLHRAGLHGTEKRGKEDGILSAATGTTQDICQYLGDNLCRAVCISRQNVSQVHPFLQLHSTVALTSRAVYWQGYRNHLSRTQLFSLSTAHLRLQPAHSFFLPLAFVIGSSVNIYRLYLNIQKNYKHVLVNFCSTFQTVLFNSQNMNN